MANTGPPMLGGLGYHPTSSFVWNGQCPSEVFLHPFANSEMEETFTPTDYSDKKCTRSDQNWQAPPSWKYSDCAATCLQSSQDRHPCPYMAHGKDGDSNHPQNSTLACPFFKMDSTRYMSCGSLRLKRIRDVKQHLQHRHRTQCTRCGENFKHSHRLRKHTSFGKCGVRRPGDFASEGITDEQSKKLAQRVNRAHDETRQWNSIWRILFPSEAPPGSPHLPRNAEETLSMMNSSLQHHGSALVADVIEHFLSERGQGHIPIADVSSQVVSNLLSYFSKAILSAMEPSSTASNFSRLASATSASTSMIISETLNTSDYPSLPQPSIKTPQSPLQQNPVNIPFATSSNFVGSRSKVEPTIILPCNLPTSSAGTTTGTTAISSFNQQTRISLADLNNIPAQTQDHMSFDHGILSIFEYLAGNFVRQANSYAQGEANFKSLVSGQLLADDRCDIFWSPQTSDACNSTDFLAAIATPIVS